MVHASPTEYPSALVLEGEFLFKLQNGTSFKAHRVTFASHDDLESREGLHDLICFVDTATDEVARYAEANAEMRAPILEAARAYPGRPARLILEAPPWMLARVNSAVQHPYPPDAANLMENQAWIGAALDVEMYGPVGFTVVTEADEVEFELPLDQSEG